MKTEAIKQLKWPDFRLVHNGGDATLGEALRQAGLRFDNFNPGIKINAAKRRGFSEQYPTA